MYNRQERVNAGAGAIVPALIVSRGRGLLTLSDQNHRLTLVSALSTQQGTHQALGVSDSSTACISTVKSSSAALSTFGGL